MLADQNANGFHCETAPVYMKVIVSFSVVFLSIKTTHITVHTKINRLSCSQSPKIPRRQVILVMHSKPLFVFLPVMALVLPSMSAPMGMYLRKTLFLHMAAIQSLAYIGQHLSSTCTTATQPRRSRIS